MYTTDIFHKATVIAVQSTVNSGIKLIQAGILLMS